MGVWGARRWYSDTTEPMNDACRGEASENRQSEQKKQLEERSMDNAEYRALCEHKLSCQQTTVRILITAVMLTA